MKKIKSIYSLITIFIALLISNTTSAQCTHTFNGYDSWGDGWNGASVTVMVNNIPVGSIAMLTGASESLTFQASDGDIIKLDWISGGYDNEISWDCTDGGNNIIAMGLFGTAAVGVGACPAPTPCATLPYEQDFETGGAVMTATTNTQSSAYLDAVSANSSLYGLHMEGNTSTDWRTPYSTGPDAFNSSPNHIASVTRDICASTDPTLTLMFDKMQTYTYNVDYCWFRLTINGVPVADFNGDIYFNGSNNVWGQMKYDLSAFAGLDFTVAFESCAKYYTGYTSTGMGGDAVYIDNISLTQTTGQLPPSTPGTISGFDLPNAGGEETYTISAVSGATSYTWSVPNGYTIIADNGTSITVRTSSTNGNITVYASNAAGNSSAQSLTITTVELITTFPYSTAFENETNDVTTASATGFTFNEVGWRNVDGDDGDWRTDAGGTGTTNSGPGGGASSGVSDHNPGTTSGKYIYTEASTPNYPSKEFHLWSPPFDLSSLTSPTLTFWYSMYSASGAQMALQYSIDNGNTFVTGNLPFMCTTTYPLTVIHTDMGTNWRQGFVDLSTIQSNTNVMFRFIIQTGTSWDSDICLDDIKLVDAISTNVSVGENITLGSSAYDNAYGLVLEGNAGQTIYPSGYNISNITVNNTNGVTVDGGDLKIDNSLTLTDGILNTGTNKVIIANTNANALSGGSTTSYINGNLRRYLATNTDTYIFPIGNGTGTSNYQRVDLINGNLVGISYIDASTSDMGGGNMSQLSPGLTQNTSVLAEIFDKNWTLTPDAQPSSGTFGVNLYLNGVAGGTIADDNFTIVKRPTGSTTWYDWDSFESTTTIPIGGAPGRTVASGYMQKAGFTSFSDFGGGGTGGGPLPIDLVSFGANEIDDNVQISWTVASQVNNDFYTIHRSTDCENWEEVSKLSGAGNSNQLMEYILFDDEPYYGTSYYRLMQTDYDGVFEIFPPVSVQIDKPLVFTINPNPVTETLFLYLEEKTNGRTDIIIYNTKGKQVYRKSFIGNFTTMKLRVKDLTNGYYILTVHQNRRTGSLKFIKE